MMRGKFSSDKSLPVKTARAWENSNEKWRRVELNAYSQLTKEHVITKVSEEFQVRLSLTEAKCSSEKLHSTPGMTYLRGASATIHATMMSRFKTSRLRFQLLN